MDTNIGTVDEEYICENVDTCAVRTYGTRDRCGDALFACRTYVLWLVLRVPELARDEHILSLQSSSKRVSECVSDFTFITICGLKMQGGVYGSTFLHRPLRMYNRFYLCQILLEVVMFFAGHDAQKGNEPSEIH